MSVMDEVKTLKKLAENSVNQRIADLFNNHESNKSRIDEFTLTAAGLTLDYSKQQLTPAIKSSLIKLANNANLSDKIAAMRCGEKINHTEKRAVLHTILRADDKEKRQVLAKSVADEVIDTERRMATIVDQVVTGQLTSASGERFTDVLAIGIGGSYYGIKVGLSALKPYQSTGINVHVIANIDAEALADKLSQLTATTTLVVVISKTFTTQETLLNANIVKQWMLAGYQSNLHNDVTAKQWFAISTNIETAMEFGLQLSHILPMWNWIGGRFSIWSAVGLPLALAIGNENYSRFKQGARELDLHFFDSDFSDNMPVLMALIGIWNRNFLNHASLAVLPYYHGLRAFPGYLQQTDMESNGKSVSISGEPVKWQTSPVIFGQEGTNGQHAFMQLIHQSKDVIPCDFIVALNSHIDDKKYLQHQKTLVANCFAQSEALMVGKNLEQVSAELNNKGISVDEIQQLANHKVMKGNVPTNTLVFNKLTPETLGALLALYEHKIFVQGTIWQLNSFDQWGVELGKALGTQVLDAFDGQVAQSLSQSSKFLINQFLASGNANK